MKAARLLAITLLLQARGKMTATELGQVLEVSDRTIYRDISSLEEARVPVVAEPGPEGGYSLPEGYRVDPTLFSGEEAASLAIGGAILHGLQEVALAESLQQALAKIEAVLPPQYRAGVRAGRERFLFDARGWYEGAVQPARHLPTLRAAVLYGRRVRLCYQGRDATQGQWRDVDPLGLVYKAGRWYLVGYCRSKDDVRTFRLGRIQEVEQLAALRDPHPTFNLARYWEESRDRVEARSPFPVRVRADAIAAADLLERPLTILQMLRHADGSLEAELDLDSLGWAVTFVLGFGSHLEVTAPTQVREAVAVAAEAVAFRHRL